MKSHVDGTGDSMMGWNCEEVAFEQNVFGVGQKSLPGAVILC